MKKVITKTVVLLCAAAMLAFSACGYSGDDDGGSGSSGKGKELTAEEYKENVSELMEEIAASNALSLELDYEDDAQVEKYVNDSKAVYEELMNLKAPDEFSDMQEKLAEGAEKMVEYLDLMPNFLALAEGSDEAENVRSEMIDVYTKGMTAIGVAYDMLFDEAGGSGGVEEPDVSDEPGIPDSENE